MGVRAAVAAIASGLLLSACAGAGGTPDEGGRIEIEMKTFAFAPGTLTLRPGEKVTLVLKNPDNVEHEFMAGRDPKADGGYKDDLLAGLEIVPKPQADHGRHGGGVGVLVQPGRTATMTFVRRYCGS